MDAGEDTAGQTKVGKLIDKYDMGDIGAEMEQLWTAEPTNRKSLREIEEHFNKELLRVVLEKSGIDQITTDVTDIYLHLRGESGTAADHTRTRRELEREGVDVDTLQSEFVSYQAIRSYLKKERNAEYDPNRDPIRRDGEVIQQLRNRTSAVTDSKLAGLQEKDLVTLGSYQLSVEINVFCEDCGKQFDVSEVLDRRGCECDQG